MSLQFVYKTPYSLSSNIQLSSILSLEQCSHSPFSEQMTLSALPAPLWLACACGGWTSQQWAKSYPGDLVLEARCHLTWSALSVLSQTPLFQLPIPERKGTWVRHNGGATGESSQLSHSFPSSANMEVTSKHHSPYWNRVSVIYLEFRRLFFPVTGPWRQKIEKHLKQIQVLTSDIWNLEDWAHPKGMRAQVTQSHLLVWL